MNLAHRVKFLETFWELFGNYLVQNSLQIVCKKFTREWRGHIDLRKCELLQGRGHFLPNPPKYDH